MLSLPQLGGTDFIAALQHLGFRVAARGAGLCTLSRSLRAVVVPETATLSPVLVKAMLRAADVDPLDFLAAVDFSLGSVFTGMGRPSIIGAR